MHPRAVRRSPRTGANRWCCPIRRRIQSLSARSPGAVIVPRLCDTLRRESLPGWPESRPFASPPLSLHRLSMSGVHAASPSCRSPAGADARHRPSSGESSKHDTPKTNYSVALRKSSRSRFACRFPQVKRDAVLQAMDLLGE